MISAHYFQELIYIWIATFGLLTADGVRHTETPLHAFTTEAKCETSSRRVMLAHASRLPALYWWCDSIPLNPKEPS